MLATMGLAAGLLAVLTSGQTPTPTVDLCALDGQHQNRPLCTPSSIEVIPSLLNLVQSWPQADKDRCSSLIDCVKDHTSPYDECDSICNCIKLIPWPINASDPDPLVQAQLLLFGKRKTYDCYPAPEANQTVVDYYYSCNGAESSVTATASASCTPAPVPSPSPQPADTQVSDLIFAYTSTGPSTFTNTEVENLKQQISAVTGIPVADIMFTYDNTTPTNQLIQLSFLSGMTSNSASSLVSAMSTTAGINSVLSSAGFPATATTIDSSISISSTPSPSPTTAGASTISAAAVLHLVTWMVLVQPL